MNKYQWRYFFTENTPKLFRISDIMKNNFRTKIKDLYDHFINLQFDSYFEIIITHFFLTIFTYNCPLELSFRIFDMFFLYDEGAIINAILAIMFLLKDKMLMMDYDKLIVYMKKDLVYDAVEKYGVDYIIDMM